MSISLEASIKNCKVTTGLAESTASARFFDPKLVVCPIWTGYDLLGRQVPYDSFMSKTAGCDSAYSRVIVENNVSRPMYSEFIQTNAAGIAGKIYGHNEMLEDSIQTGNEFQETINKTVGNFGTQWRAQVIGSCSPWTYENAMAQNAQTATALRELQQQQIAKTAGAVNMKVNG